jgi:hypothetical protein
MATLNTLDYQKYLTLPTGDVIGIHRVTLLTTADQFDVPDLADPSTAGRSVAQLRRAGDTAVTVTTSGQNTITVTGTPGVQCLIVSWHFRRGSYIKDEV